MKQLRAWWVKTKERWLTATLTVLVALSLVLSAFIWTGTPIQITVDRPGFFTRPTIGGKRSVQDVTAPSSIFLWTANNELYRMSGDSPTAQAVLSSLQSAQPVTGVLRTDREAVDAIPTGAYLQLNLMDVGSTPTPLALWLQGLAWTRWPSIAGPLYLQPTRSATVYSVRYFTGKGIWLGTLKAHSEKLAAAFTPNNQATPYAEVPLSHSALDLPYDQIAVPVEDWSLAHSVSTHVIDSFFADPTSTVAIADGHHATLYTDGLRGVRVANSPFGEDLTYLAPSAPLLGVSVPMQSQLAAAVSFINQNGGFVGQDYLTVKPVTQALQVFQFREIVSGWPLFSSIGQIAVWTQDGTVVRMTRSLGYLQELIDETKVNILSGNQLLGLLGKRMHAVGTIRLGYGIRELTSAIAQLAPVYQIRFVSGRVLYIDAQTGQPFQGTGMVSQ